MEVIITLVTAMLAQRITITEITRRTIQRQEGIILPVILTEVSAKEMQAE